MSDEDRSTRVRLEQAEAFIEALRCGEVDAVVAKDSVLMLRLQAAEAALRRSEARYRNIVENQTEMICRRDAGGAIVFVNRAYCRFFACSREDLTGKRFDPPIHEADRDATVGLSKHLAPGRPPFEFECRVQTGGGMRWTRWIMQGFFDNGGNLTETQVVGRDITAHKAAEVALRNMKSELTAKNRALEASRQEMVEYSEAVIHDFSGIIRAVDNYAEFLCEDLAESLTGNTAVYLENLRRVARAGSEMLEQLKQLGGLGKSEETAEAVDFRQLMEEIMAVNGVDPQVTIRFPFRWPVLTAPPTLLRMVLSNLIGNGIKFNRAEKKRIEVGWRQTARGTVVMYVKDNGIGIEPQFHDKIFQLFKRLHPAGEYDGSGMGLTIVRKAVQHIGGALWLESAPGRGSIFFIELPRDCSARPTYDDVAHLG